MVYFRWAQTHAMVRDFDRRIARGRYFSVVKGTPKQEDYHYRPLELRRYRRVLG